MRFNCEHFASYVQDGVEVSQQVRNVGAGLGIGLGLLLLAAIFGGGDSDERRRYS